MRKNSLWGLTTRCVIKLFAAHFNHWYAVGTRELFDVFNNITFIKITSDPDFKCSPTTSNQ
jgi:hypothetical protein